MKQLIILLFCVTVIACKKDTVDEPVYFQRLLTKVEGAANGITNQSLDITVYWPYNTGCDILEKFTQSQQGNIISVKALGYMREGICTQDAGIKTSVFNFKSTNSGVFELRFYNPDNTFIRHLVTIN